MKIERHTTVREVHTLEIGRDLLIEILAKADIEIKKDAKIYVRVPGGGDWSNENLDIASKPGDFEPTITIQWEETHEEHT